MGNNKNTFILAGNGPYDNRGCEAIVRGTIKILRHYFDDPKFIVLNFYSSEEQFNKLVSEETDKSIIHKKTFLFNKSAPIRLLNKLKFSLQSQKTRSWIIYKEIIPYLENIRAVLSVGGDNYSLDYTKPKFFTDLDDLVLSKKKPMIIWGASVGPFSKLPHYEEYMKEHLKKITGIFAREALTEKYLTSMGITKNVYKVADPAFLLDSVKPPKDKFNKEILDGAIGINLSSLTANFLPNSDLKKWTKDCAKAVQRVVLETRRPVYLIPHVTGPRSNEYDFSKEILSLIDEKKDMINLIPDNLNASETKWIISKMHVFIGSRTHSVISALSSGVPALSISYSTKALGINRDFYGNDNFTLEKNRLASDIIVQKTKELIEERATLKNQIDSVLPEIEKRALSAGQHLKSIIA
ncbi:polysaccharide pyruvyl transferase family protein [Patescibacteria group bacterium]